LVDFPGKHIAITITEASAAQKASPQVVIVEGGFGGLSAAKELAGKAVHVTLVDPTNHHLESKSKWPKKL
jgi:ribulose 1,5-bisphosphate synthetase/thiazole synthase